MKTSNAILLTCLVLLLAIELASFFVVKAKVGTDDFTLKSGSEFKIKAEGRMK